jgi:colanic acid biosynthesis glycosyl transferase WcaI
MRVLVLSHYYAPEPIHKPAELAHELTRRGHTVAVLTGYPNYPTGRLYPGFRLGLGRREELDGIPVTRTWVFPYHGNRVIGRILNYGSFMVTSVLGSFFVPACDVIYVWHPPLTIGLAAWMIGRLRRVPFVYDVQDIWPESVVVSGVLKEGWLVRLLSWIERFVYRHAGHITVVTEGARGNLLAKGVPAQKISVVPHWVDDSLLIQVDEDARRRVREHYGWDGRFVVLFAGNLGLVQGLDTLVAAAVCLQNDSNILIALIGDGADKRRLQALVHAQGLGHRIQFIERQPQEEIPAFLAAADVLLVHLKKSELSHYVIPTKTLAYLAVGRPILMAMDGAAAQLVKEVEAGIVIPPEDPAEMARAIRLLKDMPPLQRAAMGQRGRDYLVPHFSKHKVVPQYEALFQRMVRPVGG